MLEGLRVLLVEDEDLVAMVIEDHLLDLGCEVAGVACRLEDALEKAREIDVDAALLDVNLAGQLSYPVALALQERGVPFTFVTGYGLKGVPAELTGAAVIAKPFTEGQIASALKLMARGRA
jgi:CheY-like chemotaxis protein